MNIFVFIIILLLSTVNLFFIINKKIKCNTIIILSSIIIVCSCIFLLFFNIFNIKRRTENFDIKIPKIIHQTYKSKDKVPQKVFHNINKYASDYEYIFYNDQDCEDFIKNNFGQTHLDIYSKIPNKAHKADFFRYCVLYKKGGVYMDIKSELFVPLNDIIKDKHITTILSIVKGTIYQGFVAINPNNKLMSDLLNHVIETISSGKKYTYHVFTREFYNNLLRDTEKDLINGINYGKNNNYYLLQEKCNTNSDKECYDGFDRYGRCCNIYDVDNKVIKTRYSDFPW